VNLHNNLLSGPIPSEIGRLSALKDLNLLDNQINGTLPEEIGNLVSLEQLVISINHISGTLPDVFDNFRDMFVLGLSRNKFSGSLPNSFWEFDMVSNHLEKPFGLFLSGNNDLTGDVPSKFCSKVMTEAPEYDIKFSSFDADTSSYFLDESNIKCSCCTSGNCFVWSNITAQASTTGTIRPACPKTNAITINYNFYYGVHDMVTSMVHLGTSATSGKRASTIKSRRFENDVCVSPTGCYIIVTDSRVLSRIFEGEQMSYSARTNSLVRGDVCDAVDVCGLSIDQNHPKRPLLNHLTQLIVSDLTILNDPSSPKYKALCWMLTEDEIVDEFEICDGTLLQRFVILYIYFLQQTEEEQLSSITSIHTCDWRGITCDLQRKFVVEWSLSGVSLKGPIPKELGYLNRLHTINLSNNLLSGTIDGSMFKTLPFLEKFSVNNNNLVGGIPKELLTLSRIRKINMSKNKLTGELPHDVEYSKSIGELSITLL